ncbi:MAG: small subunit ribosomal protein S1 [Desulfobacteraceae bacterium Eth-SRB2]|nr:MAG: small subunit ribosomal protein S1 [Desulfobacteraceae bacterium Eth-SRB2]
MENLEKNDLTKDSSVNALSDEPVDKQPDEAGIEEKEVLKTDTSVEDVLSDDVQNENDGPVEIRETDETPVEVRETDETPVEVRETDETPVEVRETDETPVEVRETHETPVEVRETHETPVEVRETDETPVEVRETEDRSESIQKSGEESEFVQESSLSPEKDQKPVDDMESLMDMYEESFKRFAEGAVVTGRIISVDKDHVLVDIGYKSEGQIRTHEFMDEDGNLNANVGDPVDVMVEWWDEEEERVVLSKEKAAKVKVWEEIKKAYDEERTVEGVIINRVKGGFSVDIGVQAFLPGSQADLRPIRKLDEMVGKTFTFKILKYNRKRSNIVLSRRAILEEERKANRTATLASIHDGKIVEGVIKNITEYGVFVDLGGVDGLLHITDISWGRVKHPSELFSVGDEITVKVLNLDLEKERVSLGKKQLTKDPWITASEKYPVGSRIIGRVVSLTDYGAFVELEEGIEGLIHVSEMSWTRKIRHPSKVISVGEEVEAVVLDIRPENRRISLGMKQVVPNPWDVISEKYPIGTTIEGKIKNITDFGLFIGIGEGIDGLVHISDISWTKRIKHPSELYKKNDVIQAIVLDIEKDQERFSLGVKQLQTDPWKTVDERYEVGKEITGTVTNLTDFGVFVELEEGIEGLVHVSEISKEKVKTPVGKFNIGDVITAKVMNINSVERRIGLSIKRLEIEDEQSLLTEYVNNAGPATSTFGEILRENLQEKMNDDS